MLTFNNAGGLKIKNKIIQQTWDAVTAKQTGEDKFVITSVTYEPSRSNIVEAMNHSKKIIRKAHKQGNLHLLDQQVEKMISKNCFKELDEKELLGLDSVPHLFTLFNWVFNSSSASTPFRMISNTSNVSSCTTISTEQLSPHNILNPQENGLIRFSIHPIPLVADIQGAYHTIGVDEASSYLRLFFYWWDSPRCEKARVFRQVTQSFGDGGAAQGLEVGILKFVCTAAILMVSKFIIEFVRYSDNLMYSFKTKKECLEVKEDLETSFSRYSMPLKYCITNLENDSTQEEVRNE